MFNANGEKLLQRPSPRYKMLLDTVAFGILLSINDGTPLRKYVKRL